MNIFTVGGKERTAEEIFEPIRRAQVKRVIDVRLLNNSQYDGVTKITHLPYLLRELCGVDFLHLPEMAPTKEIKDAFLKHHGPWEVYVRDFTKLLDSRKAWNVLNETIKDGDCLMCFCADHEICHRGLLAERVQDRTCERRSSWFHRHRPMFEVASEIFHSGRRSARRCGR